MLPASLYSVIVSCRRQFGLYGSDSRCPLLPWTGTLAAFIMNNGPIRGPTGVTPQAYARWFRIIHDEMEYCTNTCRWDLQYSAKVNNAGDVASTRLLGVKFDPNDVSTVVQRGFSTFFRNFYWVYGFYGMGWRIRIIDNVFI